MSSVQRPARGIAERIDKRRREQHRRQDSGHLAHVERPRVKAGQLSQPASADIARAFQVPSGTFRRNSGEASGGKHSLAIRPMLLCASNARITACCQPGAGRRHARTGLAHRWQRGTARSRRQRTIPGQRRRLPAQQRTDGACSYIEPARRGSSSGIETRRSNDFGPVSENTFCASSTFAMSNRIQNRSISTPGSLSLCSRLTRTARRYQDRRYGERLRGEGQPSSGVADHAGFAIGWPRQRQQKLA